MIRAVRTSALLWRRGGARQWTVLGLTSLGVLVAATLALLALSVSPALGERGDRIAWRTPTPAADPAAATAVQRTTSTPFRGREITVVEVAPTAHGEPPVPPGLDDLLAPGEIALSPALAELVDEVAAAALGDRFPGTAVATIGPEGLALEDDLVAVIGRPAGAIPLDAPDDTVRGTAVAAFAGSGTDEDVETYQQMAMVAAVLLVVPTILLVGALARLTAAQREQRLAALRLVGATPRLVVAVTALETAAAALVGALAGIVTYLVVLPAAARIPIGGGELAVAELRLPAGGLALAAAVVPALAALSATVALRKVVIGPLGVSRRVAGRRPRVVRLLSVPAAWVLLVVAAQRTAGGDSIVPLLLALTAVIGTLAVVGPWLTWVVGALLAHGGRRPAPVLAGRRITDDARGTYRTVSGMVLAGLIAGFLFGVLPSIGAAEDRVEGLAAATDLEVVTSAPGRASVEDAVAAAGARVTWRDAPAPAAFGTIVVPDDVDPEVVRTAVLAADPEAWAGSPADADHRSQVLVEDMRRASVVLSLAALVLAAAATAIGSTASILDQRVTLARLRLAGTSVAVLQRARRWQAVVPLGLASIGAMATGAGAAQLLMRALGARDRQVLPPDVVPMAGLAVAALVVGCLAVAATRPVLVAATRTTPRE